MKKTIVLIVSLLVINAISQTATSQTQKGSDINGDYANDNVGWSVSMPASNVVAMGEPSFGGSDGGRVRIFEWNGSEWLIKGNSIYGEASGDKSGHTLHMPDENTIAIGAYLNDGNGDYSGHVRVYAWVGNTWAQKGIDLNGEQAYDRSGHSVYMPDANTLAVGAIWNDGAGSKSGHVRIFTWNGTAWVQKGTDIDGEAAGDNSGYSVSMPDANTVAIGAPDNTSVATGTGQVRVYSWDGSAWVQKGADIDGDAESDKLGSWVSMPHADYLAVGAPDSDINGENAGLVRIYHWNGTNWIQKGTDLTGEAAGDIFGYTFSMPDTSTIAIGSPNNDGAAADAGMARIYSWNETDWVQVGNDIEGEAAYDYSGRAVAMSDANNIAVGAPYNDGTASGAGHVRVFSLCEAVTGTDIISACDSYTWIDGNTYTENNNTATHTIIGGAVNGCDSILTLNLTINEASYGIDEVSGCEQYTWIDGNTYYDDNSTATHTIMNGAANGCDSIVTLNLTMNFTVFGTDVISACDEYTWIDGNTYVGSNYTATHNILGGAANGCDSIVTLNLTISNSASGIDEVTACSEYTWIDGNTYYESNNTATHTITGGAANSCDSIVTLDLNIINIDVAVSQTENTLTAILDGASYQWLDCENENSIIPEETEQSFTASVDGSYAVEITHQDCVDTSDCYTITNVNIIENDFDTTFDVYPNPNSGNFFVDLGKNAISGHFTISDITGKIVQSETFENTDILHINITEAAGTYLVIIHHNNQKVKFSIIKE